VIIEAKNVITFRREERRAARITTHLVLFEVLPAVEFDNQFCGMTDKIRDVRSDRCLSSKAHAAQAMGTQRIPHQPLRVCRIAAKCACP